jgi:hypothetical protein
MDGTGLIAEQGHIPMWREDAVYTIDHIGFPVQDEDQRLRAQSPRANGDRRSVGVKKRKDLLREEKQGDRKPQHQRAGEEDGTLDRPLQCPRSSAAIVIADQRRCTLCDPCAKGKAKQEKAVDHRHRRYRGDSLVGGNAIQ